MTDDNYHQIFEVLREKPEDYQIEPFVLDFLEIWRVIHERSKDSSLDDIKDILKDLETSYTLPFYEKYKDEDCLDFVEGWFKSYLSLLLRWRKRGGILFPLKLITYEICHHEDKSLMLFMQKLLLKEVKGTKEDFFEYMLPKLLNFEVLLDELDILILKTYQTLNRTTSTVYKEPRTKDFATHLGFSNRTITRRLKAINLLQMVNSASLIDLSQLGYETTLLIHFNPFPKEFEEFILYSTDLMIGKFSIIQIPNRKSQVHDQIEILSNYQMKKRIRNFNLSGLTTGRERWQESVPSLTNMKLFKNIPNPDLEFSLTKPNTLFRPLTPADIKIIDFISTQGSLGSVTQLSNAIDISRVEVSKRLQEYSREKLLIKNYQFYNIGLDTSVFFFISTKNEEIPFIRNFLKYPMVDVFFQEEKLPYIYFGVLKIPPKWFTSFVQQVDYLIQDFEVKIHYKIVSAVDYIKWGISLSKTYGTSNTNDF